MANQEDKVSDLAAHIADLGPHKRSSPWWRGEYEHWLRWIRKLIDEEVEKIRREDDND